MNLYRRAWLEDLIMHALCSSIGKVKCIECGKSQRIAQQVQVERSLKSQQ